VRKKKALLYEKKIFTVQQREEESILNPTQLTERGTEKGKRGQRTTASSLFPEKGKVGAGGGRKKSDILNLQQVEKIFFFL